MQADDLRLLGIPRPRLIIARLPRPINQGCKLVERISVARVRLRTSKGTTDLLLHPTSFG